MYRLAFAAAAALLTCAPASAAVYTLTIDASDLSVNKSVVEHRGPLATPITLVAGDTLDLTFDLGGVRTFQIGDFLELGLDGVIPGVATFTVNYEVLGGSPNLRTSGPAVAYLQGAQANFDPTLQDYGVTGSLSGVRAVFNITGGKTGPLNQTIFYFSTGYVPEPTTWALMIGGFGMVGATVRARRADSVRA